MSWLNRAWGKDRKLRRQSLSESSTTVTGAPSDSGCVPEDVLRELVGRFTVGSGAYITLLPPLTDELVAAQRAGTFLATEIMRGYADRLYTAIWAAIGGGGDEPPAPRYALVVRDERVTSVDDPTQPAVPLSEQGFGGRRANLALIDDGRGIDPNIHLTAAVRALASSRTVEETGEQAGLLEFLDRAWFLLAFWLSHSLSGGRGEQMGDEERRLIVDLISCCSRLHVLGDASEPPPFVVNAINDDLVVRHVDEEWVTTARVRTADGEVSSEGHFAKRDSARPLRVGALLRAQLQCDASATENPAEEFALGALKAEADDLIGARAAFERVRSHPSWSERAEASLRDLRPEEASVELLSIFDDWAIKTGAEEVPDVGSPTRTRLVEIGESLYAEGGMTLMREAHEAFARRGESHEAGWLAIVWTGIGDWEN